MSEFWHLADVSGGVNDVRTLRQSRHGRFCTASKRPSVKNSETDARLLLAGTNENIKIENDGRTVRSIRKDSLKLQFVAVPWNSTFTERRSFERLTLMRA
jgi:hypothetical protein